MRSLFVLLACLTLVACSDEKVTKKHLIVDQWNITQFSAGMGGMWTYDENDIVWEFKSNNKVTVTINGSVTIAPILNVGTHEYQIIGDKIILNETEYDFTIEDESLIISFHPEVDGTQLQLSRTE